MRRALVLTDEGARHPFRARLPRHMRREEQGTAVAATIPSSWRLTAGDMRGFATVYFASFAAVLAFIA